MSRNAPSTTPADDADGPWFASVDLTVDDPNPLLTRRYAAETECVDPPQGWPPQHVIDAGLVYRPTSNPPPDPAATD